MGTETDHRDKTAGGWTSWGFGFVVLTYFGFPAMWYWPFWMIHKPDDPPEWMLMLFVPIGWLWDTFPLYADWVSWGVELLGIN